MHAAVFCTLLLLPIEVHTGSASAAPKGTRAAVLVARMLVWASALNLLLTPLLHGIVAGQWAPRIEVDMAVHCAQPLMLA
jgi:hypothetical protein